jgi:two-component system, response regulator PdtaR
VTAIARDRTEAVACAERQRPDFALMDIRLNGDTSGVDAARLLYEQWGVRCILLSVNIDAQTRAQVAPYHPLGFIGKPFLNGQVVGCSGISSPSCLRERVAVSAAS